ncbi:putative exported protein [Burkholderia cenocepacia KC-01]|nr:putative exported protein [Burkholderia cenocepacia KC-01]
MKVNGAMPPGIAPFLHPHSSDQCRRATIVPAYYVSSSRFTAHRSGILDAVRHSAPPHAPQPSTCPAC